MKYFAYGSNLNLDDWNRFCSECGYEPDVLHDPSRAWLPDHRLAFTRYSTTRGGGVLDVVSEPGAVVEGIVFEIDENGWDILDEKEGAPGAYRRQEIVLIDSRGGQILADTYVVNPERRKAFVSPSEAYLEIVRAGMERFGIDTCQLDAAAERGRSSLDTLFVYGTLMSGEERESLLRRHSPSRVIAARTRGCLVDCGDYPGLILNDAMEVEGELWFFDDIRDLLTLTDEVEGFVGHSSPGSLFRRVITTALGEDGGSWRAWTYVWNGGAGRPQIACGSWRQHRGRGGALEWASDPGSPSADMRRTRSDTGSLLARLELLRSTVEQGHYSTATEWGGAGVVLTVRDPRRANGFYGRPHVVVTPFAPELSWLFTELRDLFAGKIDYLTKFAFYERLAVAAEQHEQAASGSADPARELLLAVLAEASRLAREEGH